MDTILYIDDEHANLILFEASFSKDYHVITTESTKNAINILNENNVKVVITDQRMPEENGIDFITKAVKLHTDVVFMILSAYTDFEIARKAIETSGVYKFLLKPWKRNELKIDINNAIERYNYLQHNRSLLKSLENQNSELKILREKLEDENQYLKEEIKINKNFESIISNDEVFLETLKNLEHIANSNAPVLISGETGTGKELIARAIHNLSDRRHNAFVCINCAAIPETLFESELFGHEKGAFTGAVNQRKGKFELSSKGTLFLDEIGEIPIGLQSKLLRAIQESEIERLGGNKTIKVDLRIVVATNRNLQLEIEKNNFRSDLFYRLNVVPVVLPPLRERKNDIPILVKHFINKFNAKYKKNIKPPTKNDLTRLMTYSWPGNIRELENIIERAVITSRSAKLDTNSVIPDELNKENEELKTLKELEKEYVIKVLKRCNYRVGGDTGAAKILGLNRTTLVEKMKTLNIKKPEK